MNETQAATWKVVEVVRPPEHNHRLNLTADENAYLLVYPDAAANLVGYASFTDYSMLSSDDKPASLKEAKRISLLRARDYLASMLEKIDAVIAANNDVAELSKEATP